MTLEGENEVARQVLSGGRTLVWRDDGSPYDNSLHVYALAPGGDVIDAVEAGAAMTPGLLEIRQARDGVVDFSFFINHKTYRLTVGRTPRLRLPLSLPTGFRYKSALSRHILFVSTL